MKNTIQTVLMTSLTIAALSLSSWAQQNPQEPLADEQPVTTVIESLSTQPAPERPLITQQDVEKSAAELPDRPRGESRTERDERSRKVEKPLLEVKGF